MTLLVATQDPDAPAETYVRQHMRGIAPGKTVGLAFNAKGPLPKDLPFLSVTLPKAAPIRKLSLLYGRLIYGFSGAPVGASRNRVIAFLRKHKVSLVLAEFGPTGAALRDICKSEGIPLIVNFHGYDATVMPKRADIRAAYELLSRDAASFVCGSRCFRETVAAAGIEKEKITVIPCGVRTEEFGSEPGRTGRRLVAIGRLTPKKAPLATLEAFNRARNSVPDLTLDVVGDGPLMTECRNYIAQHDLGACVTLHGACRHDAVRKILSSADIFVQHSITAPNGDTESQGISLVEAMASYLPTIVTDHNGFSEVVMDGETGFLVGEGDVDAMSERIILLAIDGSRRLTMAEAARHRACSLYDEKITLDQMRKHLSGFGSV